MRSVRPSELAPQTDMHQYLAQLAVYPHRNCTPVCACWMFREIPEVAYEVPAALEELRGSKAS